MNWDKTAFVIIDMQKNFTQDVPEDHLIQVIENQKKVIGLCKQHSIPIINVRFFGEGETIPEIKNELVGYEKYHDFSKYEDNAFQGSDDFLNLLDQLSIDTLFLAGINATGCVWETASGAKKNSKKVITHHFLIVDGGEGFISETRGAIIWFKKYATFLNDVDFSKLF